MSPLVEFIAPVTCFLVVLAIVLLAIVAARKDAEGEMKTPKQDTSPATLHGDLMATARMLRRLRAGGALDEATHLRLMEMLREEHRRSLGRAPDAAPAAGRTAPTDAASSLESPEVIEATVVEREPVPPAEAEQGIQYVEPLSRPREEQTLAPQRPPHVAARRTAAAGQPPAAAAAQAPSSSPLSRQRATAEAAEPPAPRRPLSDLLRGFMEEKNIRWGELVSGLLIVGCGIGLVISLRAALSGIPYFPALLFMLGTGAIHGAGMYTLRRWKLESTSRAVLIIGMLLIPLSFLAGIVLTGQGEAQRPVTDWKFLTALAVGFASFGAMAYFSGRALMSGGWPRLAAAVMVPSAAQLLINRLAEPGLSLSSITALAALPVSGFLIPIGAQLNRAGGWRRLSPRRAGEMYLLLGLAAFSLVAALALLFWKSWDAQHPGRIFEQLSPMFSLACAAVLATGLAIARRATTANMNTARVAGTALALLGGIAMAACVAAAWPSPAMLIAVGLTNGAVLVALGRAGRLPVLHCPAVACLALAGLLGFHWLVGSIDGGGEVGSRQLVVVLLMGRSAVVLTTLAAVVGGLALAVVRAGHRDDGGWLLWGASGVGALSVVIAVYTGFATYTQLLAIGPIYDGDLAAPLLLLYAVGALGAGYRLRMPYVTWAGGLLLWVGLAQALAFNAAVAATLGGVAPQRGVLTASVIHALLCAAAAVALDQRLKREVAEGRRRTPLFRGGIAPLVFWALITSIGAAPFLVLWVRQLYATHAVYAGGVALAWLALAVNFRWRQLFWAFQAMSVLTLWYTILAVGLAAGWWNGAAIDMAYLPVQVTVLALWCAAWSVLRRAAASWPLVRELSSEDVPTCDQLLLGGLVFVPLLAAAVGCWPGILSELGVVQPLRAFPWEVDTAATCGPAAWTALLAVLAALLASLWERITIAPVIGLLIASAAIALLAAGHFEDSHAVASAVRWGFAVWGVVATAIVCLRGRIESFLRRQAWTRGVEQLDGASPLFRALALVLSGGPLLVITLVAAARQLSGQPVGRPLEGSLFHELGPLLSYPLPLAMYVAMLVALALRERKASYMFGGSIVLQGAVNLLYALWVSVALGGIVSTAQYDVQLLQCNALSVSAFALLWLAVQKRLDARAQPGDLRGRGDWMFASPLLVVQAAAAGALTLALGLAACGAVLLTKVDTSETLLYVGRWPGYAAWGLALAAGVWLLRRDIRRQGVHLFSAAGLVLSALIAATVASRVGHRWVGPHLLSAGWLVVSTVCIVAACWSGTTLPHRGERSRETFDTWLLHVSALAWASLIGLVLVGVAVVSAADDPTPWWPGASTACVALLAGAAALRPAREGFRFASTLLACLATVLLQVRYTLPFWPPFSYAAPALLVALCTAWFWLLLDLFRRHARMSASDAGQNAASHAPLVRVYDVAAVVVAVVLALLVAGGALLGWLLRPPQGFDVSEPLGAATLVLLAAASAAMLWRRHAPLSAPLLLVCGVVGITMLVDQHEDTPLLPVLRGNDPLLQRFTLMAWALGLAVYAALVGQVWHGRRTLAWLGDRLGMPNPRARLDQLHALLTVGVMLPAAVAVAIELCVVLTFPGDERWLRVCAGFAPALAAAAIAGLTDRGKSSPLRLVAMLALTVAAVLVSWADMAPIVAGTREIVHFSVRLLVVLSGLSMAYAGLARWLRPGSDWFAAVIQTATVCAVGALLVLGGVLAEEAAFFRAAPPVLTTAEISMVAVVLVALGAALLMLALTPAADPLSLSETTRQAYVYAAQAVVALLFVHIFLSRPEWFSGLLRAYWPFVAMAIAFTGVGLGELFHRLRIRLLAEPFTQTGLLLPLLPALGMWVVGAEQTSRPLLLLVAGLMYALVAMLRRSMTSGLAAAVAGNAALWALMHERHFNLVENPQFWLIPPALSVLAAAQLNRRRLTEQQLTSIRYAAMLVIYISSTSEILFVRSVSQLWPPMLLTALSVLGVLAGIALRIRAFLYLGTSFVLVSIVTMVNHAVQGINQTWPWWAFGMCVGAALLLLLGTFELKRREILALLERLRQWDQ